MGLINLAVSANSNPYALRVILYKTSAPNTVAYFQDVPLPHTSSQALAFSPIDDDTYFVKVFELVSTGPDVLGQMLFSQIMSTKQKDVSQLPNLQLIGGVDVAANQDTFDGSALDAKYQGLIANTDYWVERRGQGTFVEVNDNPPFGFVLTNGAQFNTDEVFTLHFYPKIKITVQPSQAQQTTVLEKFVTVTADTTLDFATYGNSTVCIESSSLSITLLLDFLVNMPDGSWIKFVTNKGNQINTVIKAQTSEQIKYRQFGALPNLSEIILGNNAYLKIAKNNNIFEVVYFSENYSKIGNIEFGTKVDVNQIIADGAASSGNELSRSEYPRLFFIVSQMASGVAASKAAWLAGSKSNYHLGDGSTTFGIPDLRGHFPRFMDLGVGVDAERVFLGLANVPLTKQADAFKSHRHAIPVGTVGASFFGKLIGAFAGKGNYNGSSTGDIDLTSEPYDLATPANQIPTQTETKPKNIVFYPLINI